MSWTNRIIIQSRKLCYAEDWQIPQTSRELDTDNFMINRPSYGLPSHRMKRVMMFSIVSAILLIATNASFASDTLTEGSSSKRLRAQTVNSIPYQQLNDETKNKIGDILKKPSIYRRLPVTAINADPDYFRFLVRYPEVIVNIWQLMGVTQMTTDRTGPYSIDTNDGAGTISSLELVYGSENLHIFYGSGTYEGPILKRKLTGKAVLVLRSESSMGANGKPVSTSQLDVFLKIENATAGLIAKTISPLVGSTADHNFVESLNFVQRLNETTEKNGPGVQQMGNKLKIDDTVRQRFNEIVDVVFQRAINASAPPSELPSTTALRPTAAQTGRPAPRNQAQQPYQNNFQRGAANQNYATPSPRRNMYGNNAQPTSGGNQAPVYERMNDFGNRQLPTRGYQPPSYPGTIPNTGSYGYNDRGQTIQAGYDYGATPNRTVQPTASWRRQ